MTSQDIWDKLTGIITAHFGECNVKGLSHSTVAKDVRGWDSLGHMLLIADIEKEFNITFDFAEIATFTNVGAILHCLEGKLK